MSLSVLLRETEIGVSKGRAVYEKVAGDKDIVNLAAGEPSFDTPEHICQAAAEAAARGETHYPPTQGIPVLREAIAARYAAKHGVAVQPSEVQVTSGAANALFLAVQSMVDPGDRVVVLQPALSFITNQVTLAGGKAVPLWVEDGTSLLDLEGQLDRELAGASMLIANYPNNPSGRVLTDPEAQMVLRLTQKHGCYLLADEVYDEIVYDGQGLSSTFWYEGAEKVVVINSFSKTYAMTGWRLGYTISPQPIREKMTRCFAMCVSHINTPTQHAGVAALTQGQDPTQAMISEYEARRDYFAQALSGISGLKAWYPKGALYFFVDVSATGLPSSKVWTKLLEEAKVFTFPGESFGVQGDRFLRMSFANTPVAALEQAKERMTPFFGDLVGTV